MSTQSTPNVVQNSQQPTETPSHRRMTDPRPDAHVGDGPRPIASSASASRLPPKTAPPSAPLPPLPKGAMAPRRTPGHSVHMPSSNEGEATEGAVTSDIAQKPGVQEPPASPPKSPGAGRRPAARIQEARKQGLGNKDIPIMPNRRRDDPAPPAPPPKSGLLKRLRTRLTSIHSSPSLRPPAEIPEERSGAPRLETHSSHEEQREREKPSAPVPARAVPPVPEQKPKPPAKLQPSLPGRLSLAAIAEKRAEKREARAREERRATDARRAAALAKTGLLPASRRYSMAPVVNEHGNLQYDPFAKDRIRHDNGSDDGIIVEESSSLQKGQVEGGLSAAETVIREWRDRNTPRNETKDTASQPGPSEDAQKEGGDTIKTSSSADCSPQCPPPASSTPPELDTPERQEEHPAQSTGTESTSPPATPSASSGNIKKESDPPKADEKAFMLAPPPPPKKPRYVKKGTERNEGMDRTGKALDSAKGEKVALGQWRFPPTTSPQPSDSSSTPTARTGEPPDDLSSPTSPESSSSASTAVAANNRTPRVVNSPPASSSPRKNETSDEQNEKPNTDASSNTVPRAMLSPTQFPLPGSPVSSIPSSPRTCNRASTALPAPTQCSRSQESTNVAKGASRALAVSLPALSPTTSTSTSTSGGSALLRTPSTSSHGHSPVRVLDAPPESDEDANSNSRTILASITEARVTGIREFGQLAKLADLESESSDSGALPPLPPGPSQGSPSGRTSSPMVEGDSPKRVTLFGRRRTTQNDPPMITVPESYPSTMGNGLIANGPAKPRHVSSLTNLRRTVTSVASGLAGAAGVATRSRDRSPLRGSSMPTPRVPISPLSNTSGTNSLSPTGGGLLTPNGCSPGVGSRPFPLNPTMHSRGSILMEARAIEDAEERRLAELAFLD